MTRNEFRNGLAILRSLDQYEVPFLQNQWDVFRNDPYHFFLASSHQEAIWDAVQKRINPKKEITS